MTAAGLRLKLPARARHPRAARAATVELTAAASVLQWALLALAGVALWVGGFGAELSALQEQHAQHNLYAKFRAELAAGTAPLGGAMARGAPVTMLDSNAAGLHGLVVVEGTTAGELRSGPGHYPGSPLPGQPGAVEIFGRSVSFGGPFRHIAQLGPGDVITATTGQGRFRYVVEDVRRPGDPLPKPLAADGSQLTLVTSEGTGWRSGWAPSRAVYVDALLDGKPVPAPFSTTAPLAADQPMHGETSGLYALVLWLQLLLLGALGIAVGRARWGLWQAWLVGVPVVLAALWGATGSAWPLLPNLI